MAIASIGTACVVAAAGCGGGGAAASGGSGTSTGAGAGSGGSGHPTFELITKSNSSPYWLAVRNGADAAAKKLGVNLKFQAPSKEVQLQRQVTMVNNAITAHVDGLILAAQQPAALTGPVKRAEKAGIPVVTIDSGVKKEVAESFIATSNVKAAENLAKFSVKHANSKGPYGIVDFNKVATTGQERPKGFKMGMSNASGYSLIGLQISKNDIGKAKREAAAMMQSHPDLAMIFGANDRSALGVGEAVKAAGKSDQVYVAGFDADAGELPLIKSGVIDASVLQSPRSMGSKAVHELVKIKHGKSVPHRVETPYFILTPKNIDTQKAKSFIKQYVSK
jgi:ribose transport system substrate-binding protein